MTHRHPLRSRKAAFLSVLTVAAALSACGGGSSDSAPPPPVVTAAADAFTLDVGQSASLTANDRIGSANASAAASGNATFALTSGTPPTGVTVAADGTVSVGATATAPATVNLSYKLCEAGSTTNCATANAVITIPAPAIVARNDSFNLVAGGSGDVLANDTLGGTPATATRVTVSGTNTPPAWLTLSAAGLVSVGTGAVPGSYDVAYRICQATALTNCATATATVVVPALGSVSGRAIDSATALGVAGVTVTANGVTATTDATGAFSLPAVPVGSRVTVLFSSAGYADGARIASVSNSQSTDVQARLVRVGATVSLPVSAGGTATMAGSPAQVVLPAAGVQRADGSVPSGNLSVRLTPIDPASDPAVMPGDFSTLSAAVAAPIESFGALSVLLSDSAGAALNLRTGQTATVRIPVASRNNSPPATIPLFYFDSSSGRWVQEGTATLAGSGSSRYYEGTVSHFSTWNADQVMNTVRVTGCVADANGVRVANAFVQADGIDYSGLSSASTDATGSFTIAIRKDSQATLVGLGNGLLTNTLRVGPYSTDTTVSTCLALGQSGAGVTMKLTWGALPSDLDSHLYTPSGYHVYYSNKGNLLANPFANLDVDDTSSYGPEVVTITKLMVGTYKYAVNNYSGQGAGPFSASSARVELSIPGRATELFTPPASGESGATNWWLLFEFDVDARCNITVRRTGAFSTSSPTAASATPAYCTP